jgi:hypothetical protein
MIAQALAQEADPTTTRRGAETLTTEIRRGARLHIILDAPGLAIDQSDQRIVWRGGPSKAQFSVTLPTNASGRTYQVRVRVLLDSVPIGELRFVIQGTADEAGTISEQREGWTTRYRRAFLSYASADRIEVLKRAQMLRAAHISFFQDLLSLEPGERWERRLYAEIDRCELFFLFWSSNAARSEWVLRETEYALHRRESSLEDAPEIMPVVIEGPPIPKPPESLKHLHFSDPICYIIAGVETEKRAT